MPAEARARTFLVHGLRVRTALPLEGAEVADQPPDVVISYVEDPLDAPVPPGFTTRWEHRPDMAQLAFESGNGHRLLFTFTQDASRVDVLSTLAGSAETVAAILAGPGFAALLSLRGAMVLHASAVAIQTRAILILGASGSGKSTLTAALVAARVPFLAEEIVAVRRRGAEFVIERGYPRIALTPAAASLLGQPADLPLVYPARTEADKRWLDVATTPGLDSGIAIGALYVLRERVTASRPVINPLPPAQATAAVLRSIYARSGIDPERYMRDAAAMTSTLPACALHLPDSLEHLPGAVDDIIADATSRVTR